MQRFTLLAVQVQKPVLLAIGMAAGSSWYFSIGFEPDFGGLLAAWLVSIFAVWWIARRSTRALVVILAWMALGITTGAISGSLATKRVQHATLQQEIGPVLLEGWVQSALPARRGVRLRLQVHAVDGLGETDTPAIVRVTHILALETEPGRFVRCWVVLRPPPAPVVQGDYAFDRQAWYGGLGAVGYVQGRCRGGALGGPSGFVDAVRLTIAKARRQLANHVFDRAGGDAGGFAAALASGDRSFMSEADQEALRRAGLAHLLAISGLHMGIVGGLIFLIVWRGLALVEPIALRWNVKKIGAIIALAACASYLIISGTSVSTQRAFMMAAILFGAVLIDRTALSLRSLALAMIVILLLAPWSVLTPGFQMSFAATSALVATYERWNRRRRAQGESANRRFAFWLKSLIVTTTVSGFATLPFALYHFGRAAPFGFVANLFAMPIISLITAPSAALALILAPLGLEGLALKVFGGSLSMVLDIAHYFSNIDAAFQRPISPIPIASFVTLIAALALFSIAQSVRLAWVVMLGGAAIAGVIWTVPATPQVHLAPSGEVFFEHPNGRVERLVWREGAGLAPLRFADHSVDRICSSVEPCSAAFGAHTIKFHKSHVEIVPAEASPNIDTVFVHWSDIESENGVSLSFRDGRVHKREKPDCGSRAWRTCRSDKAGVS